MVGCSISTRGGNNHLAWLNTSKKDGGIQGVTYPIVADLTKELTRVRRRRRATTYGGNFIIDKSGTVMAQNISHRPIGRSVDEAYLLARRSAGSTARFARELAWKGEKAMKATTQGGLSLLRRLSGPVAQGGGALLASLGGRAITRLSAGGQLNLAASGFTLLIGEAFGRGGS